MCDEQDTYASLYDSFPNGSDLAIRYGPGHHQHHHHGHQTNLKEKSGNESADTLPNFPETERQGTCFLVHFIIAFTIFSL